MRTTNTEFITHELSRWVTRIRKSLQLCWQDLLSRLTDSRSSVLQYFNKIRIHEFVKSVEEFEKTNSNKETDSPDDGDDGWLDNANFPPHFIPLIHHAKKRSLSENVAIFQFQQLIGCEISFREVQKNKNLIAIGSLWWFTNSALNYYKVRLSSSYLLLHCCRNLPDVSLESVQY